MLLYLWIKTINASIKFLYTSLNYSLIDKLTTFYALISCS